MFVPTKLHTCGLSDVSTPKLCSILLTRINDQTGNRTPKEPQSRLYQLYQIALSMMSGAVKSKTLVVLVAHSLALSGLRASTKYIGERIPSRPDSAHTFALSSRKVDTCVDP